MDPTTLSGNYYQILGVPKTATTEEIEKAYRKCARKSHPDKAKTEDERVWHEELIKTINTAKTILTNPETRKKYDSTFEKQDEEDFDKIIEEYEKRMASGIYELRPTRPNSGLLIGGAKNSDLYLRQIAIWIKEGASKDEIPFIAPQDSNLNSIIPAQKKNFFQENTPQENLDHLIYQITDSSTLGASTLTVPLENLSSPHWNHKDNPIGLSLSENNSLYDHFIEIEKLITASFKFSFKDNRNKISHIISHLNAHYAKRDGNFILHSIFSAERKIPNTLIPLLPIKFLPTLGYIPNHEVIEIDKVTPKDWAYCGSCHKEFGISLWKNNCELCGSCECSDCLQFMEVPDYSKPVPVCKCCINSKIPMDTANDWVKPLYDQSVRSKIKNEYLTLIENFLHSNQLLDLSKLFMSDKNYEKALICIHYSIKKDQIEASRKSSHQFTSAGIDKYLYTRWREQIEVFLNNKNYALAKMAASFLPNIPIPIITIGTLKRLDFTHTLFPFVLIDKEHLSAIDLEKKSTDETCSYNLAALALYKKLNDKNNIQRLLHSIFKSQSINNVKYIHFCLTLDPTCLSNEDLAKWFNTTNYEEALKLIFLLEKMPALDWSKIQLNSDREHLKWPFIYPLNKPNVFDKWLGAFENLLKISDGKNAISFFRMHFPDTNFISSRDKYLASGDLTKAFICHLLTPYNRLSFEDLAIKWQNKSDVAAATCFMLDTTLDINTSIKLFEKYFSEGKHTIALTLGIQKGLYNLIKEKVTKLDSKNALLYLSTLWKHDSERKLIHLLDICKKLFFDKNKKDLLQKILIKAISEINPLERLEFYTLLANILSAEDLQMFVEAILEDAKTPQIQEWFQKTQKKVKLNLKQNLRRVFNQYLWIDLLPLIKRINPTTVSAINHLVKEIHLDQVEGTTKKAIGYLIRAANHIYQSANPDFAQAMNDINQALLNDSSSDCIDCATYLVDAIKELTNGSLIINPTDISKIEFPKTSQYLKLKETPELNILLRTEKNLKRLKLGPFQVSMSLIDLCMAIPNAAGLAQGFLEAASELLQAQLLLNEIQDKNTIYAYRRAILELVQNSYTISKRHLSPLAIVYVIRSSIAILTASFNKSQTVRNIDTLILNELYDELLKLVNIVPNLMRETQTIYDSIYLNLIHGEFLKKYLSHRTCLEPNKPIYQYYLFEGGTVKKWFNADQLSFEEERKKTMGVILHAENKSIDHVEALMQWPLLPKDKDGWYPIQREPLRLAEEAYSSVEGIQFDLNTGEIGYILQTSTEPNDNLVNDSDIAQVMSRGIAVGQFTLDPPSTEMDYHPCQKMLYEPKALEGTDYLGTLLHADMLLKMLTTGVEISANAPFDFRDTDKHLIKRLPKDMRKKIKELRKKQSESKEKVNRFWIQADTLEYFKDLDNNRITYRFGACKMKVFTHPMVRDPLTGELKDTLQDADPNSVEAEFAKWMSDEYDRLAYYFPELARLAELVKIQAMSNFTQNIYNNSKNNAENINIPISTIDSILTDLRKQFTYPLATQENIESNLDNLIRMNGINRSQVSYTEITETKAKIKKQLEENESDIILQLEDSLKKNFHTTNNLRYLIIDWLQNRETKPLIDILKQAQETYQKEVILRICRTCDRLGIASSTKDMPESTFCNLVPAAFKFSEHRITYGGVSMNPRYVEGINQSGVISGVMTSVERVTGTTHTALRISGSVNDIFQQNSFKQPVAACWKSAQGANNLVRYTHHSDANTIHHHDPRKTTCTNYTTGNSTTFSGKGHRCWET